MSVRRPVSFRVRRRVAVVPSAVRGSSPGVTPPPPTSMTVHGQSVTIHGQSILIHGQ